MRRARPGVEQNEIGGPIPRPLDRFQRRMRSSYDLEPRVLREQRAQAVEEVIVLVH